MTEVEAMNQLIEPDWQKEVSIALVKVALPIAAQEGHPAQTYAKQVINNVDSYVNRFQIAILADIDLAATSRKTITDSDTGKKYTTHIDIAQDTLEECVAKWFAAFAS